MPAIPAYRRRAVRAHAVSTAMFTGLHVALGLTYGDTFQVLSFLLMGVVAVLYGLFGNRFRESAYPYATIALDYLGLLLCQVLLPVGAATAIMLLPYCASAKIYLRDWRFGLAMIVFGSVTVAALPFTSLATEWCAAVPVKVTFASTFALTFTLAVFAVERARARTVVQEEELAGFGARLTHQSEGLVALHAEFEHTNAAVAAANAELGAQLSRETAITAQLGERRIDEEELVRAIHHDLREPLRSIVSFNQLIARRLRREPDAGAAAEYLAFAEDGGRRMVRMLDDLLAYTRGGNEPVTEVDLRAVLDDVVHDLHHLLQRTGARVTVGEVPTLMGYPTQLAQLCQNLLANAIKFARPGVPPRVTVGCRDEGGAGGVLLDFCDNGIGIPAHQLGNVFGLFNRAHEGGDYEGGGVGLALCRRIAIAHGAPLTVTSVPGEGTTFTLALPARVLTVVKARTPATAVTPVSQTVTP